MDPRSQLEHEENILEEQLSAGEISLAEYNESIRDLEREYRAEAEESAQEAYRDTLENF
jgi:hypothetical protein